MTFYHKLKATYLVNKYLTESSCTVGKFTVFLVEGHCAYSHVTPSYVSVWRITFIKITLNLPKASPSPYMYLLHNKETLIDLKLMLRLANRVIQ